KAFSATSVAVVSTLGPDRGKAQITLDRQVVATADLYAPTQQTAQIVWSASGLKGGTATQTLKLTALNSKHAASSGTRVDYDAVLTLKYAFQLRAARRSVSDARNSDPG